ncbi:hypothetical protein MXB_4402 [Myxobolus squamalis]|nr:hypothetical protein MXB_4402 [Myxobolus squamalis]
MRRGVTIEYHMILKVVVHPSVLFSIINNFERKKSEGEDTSGFIVGKIVKNIVYLKHAYPVKCELVQDSLQIDTDSIKPGIEMHHRVHPSHLLVGWYSTKIDDPTFLINNYLPKDIPSLVYLRVRVAENDLCIDTFIGTSSGVPSLTFSVLFIPVPYEISATQVESTILNHCMNMEANTKLIKVFTESQTPIIWYFINLTNSLFKQLKDKMERIISMLNNENLSTDARAIVESKLKNVSLELNFNSIFGEYKENSVRKNTNRLGFKSVSTNTGFD